MAKRVQLPNGKTVTINPVQVCPECKSDFVVPTDWWENPDDSSGWFVDLFCSQCLWREWGRWIKEAELDEYDVHLDEGMATIEHDLKKLTVANLSEYVEWFVAALRADGITPFDF